MINEIVLMNGYGLYIWSAYIFTLIGFVSLFLVTKLQLLKEQKRFVSKFGLLNVEKTRVAKSQNINKEILANTLISKI
jgi:heme exporter protein D